MVLFVKSYTNLLCAIEMRRLKYKIEDVLCFSLEPKPRKTVKRYFDIWRANNGIPERCDNPICRFHTSELSWNSQPLALILDHENGNSKDNRTVNLRYLCPNCDAQLPTRGGKNKGRIVNESDGGFQVKHRNGRKDQLIFPKTEKLRLTTHPATIENDNEDKNT